MGESPHPDTTPSRERRIPHYPLPMQALTTTATQPTTIGARVSTTVSPSSNVIVVAQPDSSGEGAASPKKAKKLSCSWNATHSLQNKGGTTSAAATGKMRTNQNESRALRAQPITCPRLPHHPRHRVRPPNPPEHRARHHPAAPLLPSFLRMPVSRTPASDTPATANPFTPNPSYRRMPVSRNPASNTPHTPNPFTPSVIPAKLAPYPDTGAGIQRRRGPGRLLHHRP